MKRTVIACVLLISVLCCCTYETIYIKRYCKEKSIQIENCEKLYAEDKEKCKAEVIKLKKEWEKDHIFLMLFINHSIIDEITMEATKMPSYVKSGDDGEFYAACAVIKRALDQMKNDQRMTVDTFY